MNNRLENMLEVRKDGNGEAGLPESKSAEMGLLGSLMIEPIQVMDECVERAVTPRHFLHPHHAIIFEVCRDMIDQQKPVDFISLTQRLGDLQLLEKVGGAGMVTELFTFVPGARNASHYIGILCEKFARRRILGLAKELTEIAYEHADDVELLISRCEDLVLNLRAEVHQSGEEAVQHCKVAVSEALDHIEAVYHNRNSDKPLGMSSGIPDWDRRTGGFRKGDMIVIGARPSQGKSALGMQIAEHNAFECNLPVLFFSLEMMRSDLMERSLLSRCEIDLQRLRDGFFSNYAVDKLSRTAAMAGESALYIDQTRALTVAQFRSRARMAKTRWKIELIIVDYLQLMRSTSKRAQENRQIEIAEISATIKAVAGELQIPIIVLSQLSRDVETLGRQPKLSDLKESGAIEQDADQVLLIHQLSKREMDKQEEERRKALNDDEEDSEKLPPPEHNALLLLRKQRKGPVRDILVNWVPQYTTFRPVTKTLYSNKAKERER